VTAVPVDADDLRRMYVQIALGCAKANFPCPLDAEVDRARAAGLILDVPS
jgi:hypothetical protein